MPSLKPKEIKKMTKQEREKRLLELKMELIKSKVNVDKSKKAKEIKKLIARIKTIHTQK